MTHPPSRHSLKTRITLATLGVFLASLWTLSLFSTRSLQRDIEKLVSADQLATAGLIAEQLDHELSERLQTLQALAGSIAPHIGKPEQMQRFLDERRDLHAVAHRNRQVLEHRAPDGPLARQRLDDPGQFRPVQRSRRPAGRHRHRHQQTGHR